MKMLRMIYRKLSQPKDYRFLDAELYRKQTRDSVYGQPLFENSEQASLKADSYNEHSYKVHSYAVSEQLVPADMHYFRPWQSIPKRDSFSDHAFITVDVSPRKQNEARFNERVASQSFLSLVFANDVFVPKLGVFSDNKAYSAFVRTELAKLEIDIQHFNHPDTFTEANFIHFDNIDAWIVFISDDVSCEFLEKFIDRYIDKPTLFMVPKTGRKTAANSISEFVKSLMPEKSDFMAV